MVFPACHGMPVGCAIGGRYRPWHHTLSRADEPALPRSSGRGTRFHMSSLWLELARDARKAASRLLGEALFRSCVSRAYYAAYSKVSHELVVTAGLVMAADREGPAHASVRRLIETSMPNMEERKRVRLSELVGRLYTLRIDADYKPSVDVDSAEAREAMSIMNTVFESF
jgi:uncharacterized protein (UPF0332 family)